MGNNLRWIGNTLFLLVLISLGACSSPPPQPIKMTVSLALPGQEIWKQGVSSYMFGTNDTHEWADNNNSIATQPRFQQALRAAGFTLMRSFFPNNASDTVILQRLQTIQKSGAN